MLGQNYKYKIALLEALLATVKLFYKQILTRENRSERNDERDFLYLDEKIQLLKSLEENTDDFLITFEKEFGNLSLALRSIFMELAKYGVEKSGWIIDKIELEITRICNRYLKFIDKVNLKPKETNTVEILENEYMKLQCQLHNILEILEKSSCSDILPDEMWQMIISYLSPKDDAVMVSLVSKRFLALSGEILEKRKNVLKLSESMIIKPEAAPDPTALHGCCYVLFYPAANRKKYQSELLEKGIKAKKPNFLLDNIEIKSLHGEKNKVQKYFPSLPQFSLNCFNSYILMMNVSAEQFKNEYDLYLKSKKFAHNLFPSVVSKKLALKLKNYIINAIHVFHFMGNEAMYLTSIDHQERGPLFKLSESRELVLRPSL